MRGLLKHLLYIRETWVRTHLSDDLNAITERAYHVWPNRLRGSFTLLKKKGVASAKRLKKSCEKRIQGKTRKSSSPAPDCDNGNGHGDAAKEQSIGTCVGLYGSNKYTTCMNEEQSDEDTNISSDNGVDIDGDLFYDPTDPLNESDDEGSVCEEHRVSSNGGFDNDWAPFDEPPIESNTNEATPDIDLGDRGTSPQVHREDESTSPQILEELPLPRMFIP